MFLRDENKIKTGAGTVRVFWNSCYELFKSISLPAEKTVSSSTFHCRHIWKRSSAERLKYFFKESARCEGEASVLVLLVTLDVFHLLIISYLFNSIVDRITNGTIDVAYIENKNLARLFATSPFSAACNIKTDF